MIRKVIFFLWSLNDLAKKKKNIKKYHEIRQNVLVKKNNQYFYEHIPIIDQQLAKLVHRTNEGRYFGYRNHIKQCHKSIVQYPKSNIQCRKICRLLL